MNESRKKMLERVRAILSKTMENGCTEGEAMAALAKARELMAAYDISEAEIGHTQETESATIHYEDKNDPYQIKKFLAASVARFTRCKGWQGNDRTSYSMAFCGLESDVIFATWLLDTLQRFVMRELKNHQDARRAKGLKCPRIIGASFVLGCANRISERLKELTPVDPVAESNGNALVVSRNALITEAMAKAGIRLRKIHARPRSVDANSLAAGQSAGNAAQFNRPVSSGGPLLLR